MMQRLTHKKLILLLLASLICWPLYIWFVWLTPDMLFKNVAFGFCFGWFIGDIYRIIFEF